MDMGATTMPKINVYLSDDLAEAVKAAALPVSAICQRALSEALVDTGTAIPADGPLRKSLSQAGINGVTARANEAFEYAARARRDATSIDLLEGIRREGGNLALVVLASSGVDVAELLERLREVDRQDADSLVVVAQRAVDEAVALADNYIGCEHLLLGLAAGDPGEPVADALRASGVDAPSLRQSVKTAHAAMTYEKDRSATAALPASVRTVLESVLSRLDALGHVQVKVSKD